VANKTHVLFTARLGPCLLVEWTFVEVDIGVVVNGNNEWTVVEVDWPTPCAFTVYRGRHEQYALFLPRNKVMRSNQRKRFGGLD